MSDNRLFLHQKGLFRGEFVVIDQRCSFSIGDYIEVVLKDKPFLTGETVTGLYGEAKRIVGFPLTVVSCCCIAEIDVTLSIAMGISCRHWFDCLNVGEKSVVISHVIQFRSLTSYVPKIDGWIPGVFRKRRVPTQKNFVQ